MNAFRIFWPQMGQEGDVAVLLRNVAHLCATIRTEYSQASAQFVPYEDVRRCGRDAEKLWSIVCISLVCLSPFCMWSKQANVLAAGVRALVL